MAEGSGSVVEGEVVVRPAAPAVTPAAIPSTSASRPAFALDRTRLMAVQGQAQVLLARRPAITLGGAFALGILLGRLV